MYSWNTVQTHEDEKKNILLASEYESIHSPSKRRKKREGNRPVILQQ